MVQLNIEMPDFIHQSLKSHAALAGVSVRDFVAERIIAEFGRGITHNQTLRQAAEAWEKLRDGKPITLDRGEKSFHDVIHEGHRW